MTYKPCHSEVSKAVKLLAAAAALASAVSTSAITVAWDANTEPNLGGYNVYWGEVGAAPVKFDAGMNTSVVFNSLSAGRTYTFFATAYDAEGWESEASVTLTYTVPMPVAAPTSTKVTAPLSSVAGVSTINVKWNAVIGATGYNVKRGTSVNGPWTTVASSVAATSVSDLVPVGVVYYYTVSAVNGTSQSANSNVAGIYAVPPVPSAFAATALSATKARISWVDRSSDEDGFALDFWNGSAWVVVGGIGANATSAELSGLVSGATYSFRMRAVKGGTFSKYTGTIRVTMP